MKGGRRQSASGVTREYFVCFLIFHFCVSCYVLWYYAVSSWARVGALLTAFSITEVFRICIKRFGFPFWCAMVVYGCLTVLNVSCLQLLNRRLWPNDVVYVPGFDPPVPDFPSTTSGEWDVLVAPQGVIVSPYRDSMEAGLVSYAMRSALADRKPYVTGDDFAVVIPCRDEAEYVPRTIKYTVDNTPPENLKEIIIVDDASQEPIERVLNAKLSKFYLSKVKVHRFQRKEGLIRARIYGADHSTAANIFFLDGHCRPKPGWLKPLLQHLKSNYKRIAAPVIQDIRPDTWEDAGTSGYKMMFDWTFEFSWYEDLTNEVPLSSGGILALTRKWWEESGKYDSGMLEWGGENLEQSMRVWMCGGEIYAVRNSFVGHIFNRPPKPNPNNQLVTQVQKNQKRAAKVWLDDHYRYFEQFHSIVKTLDEGEGLEQRIDLRKRLNCLPFEWYTKKFRTAFERGAMLVDEFRHLVHSASGLCVTARSYIAPASPNEVDTVVLVPCASDNLNQQWMVVAGNRMIMNYGTKKCVDRQPTAVATKEVYLRDCRWSDLFQGQNDAQFWQFDVSETKRIFSPKQEYTTRTGNDATTIQPHKARDPTSWCLTAGDHPIASVDAEATLVSVFFAPCDPTSKGSKEDAQMFAWQEKS